MKSEQPGCAGNIRKQAEPEAAEHEPGKPASKPDYAEKRDEIAETSRHVPKIGQRAFLMRRQYARRDEQRKIKREDRQGNRHRGNDLSTRQR